MLFEFTGYYGSGKTEATIFVYECYNGSKWYCIEGSVNVNKTYDEIKDGTNVEDLQDHDFFTASKPVNSTDDLENEVEN